MLHKLTALIASDRFLSSVADSDIDALLDARDMPPFDTEWVRVSRACAVPDSNDVDSVREAAFKRTFDVTESPDAAGYVSDDFGLLAQYLSSSKSDPWLVSLFHSYACGELPHGVLSPSTGELADKVLAFNP